MSAFHPSFKFRHAPCSSAISNKWRSRIFYIFTYSCHCDFIHILNQSFRYKSISVDILSTNCGKFLKRWEYQTTWPASWEICRQVKEQQLEPTTDQFKIGKGVRQGCILSLCLVNLNAEYIMRNARLDEAQDGIQASRRNINNLRYADDITLMAESEGEVKSLLM